MTLEAQVVELIDSSFGNLEFHEVEALEDRIWALVSDDPMVLARIAATKGALADIRGVAARIFVERYLCADGTKLVRLGVQLAVED